MRLLVRSERFTGRRRKRRSEVSSRDGAPHEENETQATGCRSVAIRRERSTKNETGRPNPEKKRRSIEPAGGALRRLRAPKLDGRDHNRRLAAAWLT